MIEQLIVGLVLAGASGLAYIAYKHPDEFMIVYIVLSGILMIAFVGYVGYEVVLLYTENKIVEAVDSSSSVEIRKAFDTIDPEFWKYFLPWFACMLYLQILSMLPKLGIVDKRNGKDSDA